MQPSNMKGSKRPYSVSNLSSSELSVECAQKSDSEGLNKTGAFSSNKLMSSFLVLKRENLLAAWCFMRLWQTISNAILDITSLQRTSIQMALAIVRVHQSAETTRLIQLPGTPYSLWTVHVPCRSTRKSITVEDGYFRLPVPVEIHTKTALHHCKGEREFKSSLEEEFLEEVGPQSTLKDPNYDLCNTKPQ